MYTIETIDDGIKVSGLKDFNIEHIFECGQAFNWEKTEDDTYIIVAYNKVIELEEKDDDLYIYNSNEEDFVNIWHKYFDLDRDYFEIKKELAKTKAYSLNESLQEAMDFGYGIRILQQDQFEMIVSFIISANNQIPRIKKSIKILSETYGDFIQTYKGNDYYAFPRAEVLAKADPAEIKEVARVGFRNQRIVDAGQAFLTRPEDFSQDLSDEKLGENLIELNGVGPKVRDCILLFGYNRPKTFPVDVWVKRLMETLYIGHEIPNKKILEKGTELFGDLRGYAQQYLFYYARENKIGK